MYRRKRPADYDRVCRINKQKAIASTLTRRNTNFKTFVLNQYRSQNVFRFEV